MIMGQGDTALSRTNGYFMEPQNFSVNDGNGIRTIIFFAGCPLRCQWCSNPESYTDPNKLAYYSKTCIQCGRCTSQCPYGVSMDLNLTDGRRRCIACGLCVKVCPTGSRKRLVHNYSCEQIVEIIEKQRIFYKFSGGGVTFSGGEATLQEDILRKLAYTLYDMGIDLAIETSGYFDFDGIKDILEKQSQIFIDIKHMDSDMHRAYTGLGNEKILENISRLAELKVPVIVRIPVIDGVNSDRSNIGKTAQFVSTNVITPRIELLPYHPFGSGKYEALGLPTPLRPFKTPSPEYLGELYQVIEAAGVEVVSYK